MSAHPSTLAAGAALAGPRVATLLVLGPPVVWMLRIATSYILVPYACQASESWPIHLATVAAVTVIGLMTVLAVRGWRGVRHQPNAEAVLAQRDRFLAGFAALSGGFFLLVVIAEGAMGLLIGPCL
jgi:hypothetical protein